MRPPFATIASLPSPILVAREPSVPSTPQGNWSRASICDDGHQDSWDAGTSGRQRKCLVRLLGCSGRLFELARKCPSAKPTIGAELEGADEGSKGGASDSFGGVLWRVCLAVPISVSYWL